VVIFRWSDCWRPTGRASFPWTADPITWWSPDPRGIIELDSFHVPESLAKVIRKETFEVTIDKAFRQVMQACATPGPKRRAPWITSEFIEAYTGLHKLGHAHSVECWQEGKLVGGVYGVAIGGLFAGESMFHLVANASKVALHQLVQHLRKRRLHVVRHPDGDRRHRAAGSQGDFAQ
jgi:leucyl/phenylalanyl-tRNA--protein transferase